MSSLFVEDIISTGPSGSDIGVKIDEINVSEINVDRIIERTVGSGVNIIGNNTSFNSVTKFLTGQTISTSNATPATLYIMSTIANTAYYMTAEIMAANTTDNETAAFKKSIKIKNVSGIVTASSEFDTWSVTDTTLGAASISFAVSGANVELIVTGIVGKSIKWVGEIKQIITSF